MVFHGTLCRSISITRSDARNSMEFSCHQKCEIWSCSDPYGTWSKYNSPTPQWHFHGTWEWANSDGTGCSMELHGSAPISMTGAVPWNYPMEFHGTCQFRWHEQLHGIPWNLEWTNFEDTIRYMDFHGFSRDLESARGNFDDKSSSVEFYASARVIEIVPLQVLWNCIEGVG